MESPLRKQGSVNLNTDFEKLDSFLNTKKGSPKDDLANHVSRLAGAQQTPSNRHILNRLLEDIQSINFKDIAGLTDNDNITQKHLLIITVEELLKTAKKGHWDIRRNNDSIYVFNGAFWSMISKDDIKTFLGQVAEKMGVDKYNARYFQFRESLYKQFLESGHLPNPEIDKNKTIINLSNGTLEIKNGVAKLKQFDPDDFITYQLPFEYDPFATAPTFLSFLDEVLPDKNLQKILAEYLGYVFVKTSALKLEKVLILHGTGANGKSVVFDIVCALFGKNNICNYSLKSLTNDSGYYRAMMSDRLLNYASEIDGKLETNLFKQLASGEPIEARLPFGTPFIMTNYAKLIFNCNELPIEVEHTNAFFRRFLIIPFSVNIPKEKQDKNLAKKIINAELPGIFNWIMEGLRRLMNQGDFTESDYANFELERFKKESDNVRLFIDETGYKPSFQRTIPLKDMYNEYRTFCSVDGYKPVANKNFRNRLSSCGFESKRDNTGYAVYCEKSS